MLQLELELDGYVNERCPAQCSEQHDSPEAAWSFDGMFECPDTGDVWYYEGPDSTAGIQILANWHLPTERYPEDPFLWDGHWYRSYDDADIFTCEGCERTLSNESYGSDGYCASCADQDDESSYYDDESRGDSNAMPTCAARDCESHDVTHYHVITEKVYCALHVRKMKRENAAPIPSRELVAA